jgi:putative peptidoglycan lipid II flippase
MDGHKSVLKSTFLVTILSFLGIFIGFISQLIIANYYGASIYRDLYFIAISIPLFIASVINGSLGLIFLPKTIDLIQKGDKEKLNEFITSSFLFIILLILAILLLFFFLKQLLIPFFFSSYNVTEQLYLLKLLFILMPSVLFNVVSNLLGSLFQVRSIFFPPAFSLIFSSLINIIFFYFFNNIFGLMSLAYGYLLGCALSSVLLLQSLAGYSFRLKLFNFDLIDLIKTSFSLFFGGLVFRSSNVVEKYLASSLAIGSVSYLGYSGQIMIVLGTLTSNGIGVTIYPILSKFWSTRNFDNFLHYFNKSIRIILLLTIPLSFFFFFYGHFFISIIFERGKFTRETTESVSQALKYSLPAFVFQGIGTVLVKLYYISGKTKVNTIISFIEIFIFVSLSFILSRFYSFVGISISLSISTFINIVLSFYFVNKSIIRINFKNLLIDTLKIISLSFLSIICVQFFYASFIFLGEIMSFLFGLIVGIVIFILGGYLIKVDEIIYLMNKVRAILKVQLFNCVSDEN